MRLNATRDVGNHVIATRSLRTLIGRVERLTEASFSQRSAAHGAPRQDSGDIVWVTLKGLTVRVSSLYPKASLV